MMTDERLAELTASAVAMEASRDYRTDGLMAPFAELPLSRDFDAAGRCKGCGEVTWISDFVVWPTPKDWPPIRVSEGCYCRPCMIVMGVGTDGR